MKAKRIAAWLMAVGMVLSLAGCGKATENDNVTDAVGQQAEDSGSETMESGSNTEDATKITFPLEEPIELDVFVCTGDSAYTFEETAIFRWMEEKTNVKLNVTNVNLTELNEKRNVQINAGDYPDLYIKAGMSPDELLEYGSEGILLPLEDLLRTYAPNYCAIMDERDCWAEVTSADGHIYSTYEVNKRSIGDTPLMWINQTWLDNVGLDMPTNADEFYEVLVAFDEQDADGDGDPNNEIPWIASNDITPVENIMPYFGFNVQGWWDAWAVSQDGTSIEFYPITEQYKEALAFITKCYEEGLLYKDTFSLTCEQVRAMGQTDGSIGVFCDWHPGGTVGYYDEDFEENKILEYTAMIPWEGAATPTKGGLNRGAFAITDKCEYPEIMTAWVDLMYSDEGSMVCLFGIEGDTYDMVDGMVDMREESVTWGENIGHALIQMGGGTFSPRTEDIDVETYVDLEKDPTANLLKDTIEYLESAGKLHDPWPTLLMTEEEIASNADVTADVDAYRNTYRAEVITGQKDLDATWDEYCSELEAMGIQTAIDNMNAAYARYLESK